LVSRCRPFTADGSLTGEFMPTWQSSATSQLAASSLCRRTPARGLPPGALSRSFSSSQHDEDR
jgi:hypothetical protein